LNVGLIKTVHRFHRFRRLTIAQLKKGAELAILLNSEL
jgi:hypothetical protein